MIHMITALQAGYDEKLKRLLAVADRAGALPAFTAELKQIERDKNGLQPALVSTDFV